MRKFVVIFLLAFILSVNAVFAYSVSAPTQTFSVPRLAAKQIDITVSGSIEEDISVNIIDAKPWVTLSPTQIALKPGVPQKVSVFVSPFIGTNIGMYKVSLLFESLSTKELKRADVFVSIESGNIVNLEKIVVAGNLEPLGSAKVSVYVKNRKTTTVQNVEVFANISSASKYLDSIDVIIPRLDPDEEKIVDKTVSFDRLAMPETYTVDAYVKYLNEVIDGEQTFRLASKPVIQVERTTKPLLFGAERKIVITNAGNVAGEETITEPLSGFDRVFYYGDQPTLRAEGVYTWLVKDIMPGETKVIEYGTDFTPFFLVVFALLVVGWIYIKKMRTVRIKKYIVQRKKIEEGEEFTVAIEIKNAIGKETNAEITDFVPAVFHVKDGDGPKPVKKKGAAGTELGWSVKNIKKNEERVFIYKIVPIFGIHGTITLPKASVIFDLYGRKFENRSFAHSVGLPPETPEESFKNFFRKKK